MQASGANSLIIYDSEDTFGSDPSTPDCKVLPFKSEGLKQSRNLFESEAITASRNPKKAGRGSYDVAGNIELEISPYIAEILRHIFGTNVTTGADPYVHTMKVGALPAGLVIEKGFTDLATPQYFKYNGCRVNQLNLSFRPEGIIQGSIDIMGKKETVGTSTLDATSTDLGHKPFDAFEITVLDEGGSAIATVTELDISMSNNLDGGVYVIDPANSGERASIPEGKVGVTGTLKALFDDITLYNKAVNHTESSLKITLSRGNGLGSADNESLEFLIPELVYGVNAPVIAGQQGVLVELPIKAFYDNSTEATSIQAILKNTQSVI